MLESASDAVVSATPEEMIKSWGSGAERLFGYTSQEAVGQHISMLAPPDRSQELAAFLRRALDGDRVEQLERETPLVGRIVAVADAFDAITHDRPYRGARSVAEALDELRRHAGSQFDPDVLAAFMALDHDALVESS